MRTVLETSLPKAYYLDPGVFAQETERIFHREWFFVGREDGVAAPGEVLALDVAGESVLVTRTGTSDRTPFPGLSEDERTRHKGELLYPNFFLSLSADHVAAFVRWPKAADRTRVVVDFLFRPDEMAKPTFDPTDAVSFWDTVNRQDWGVRERVQLGMASRAFRHGYYAPMENLSADIRRYVAERLGPSREA